MDPENRFKAPWDGLVKGITASIIALLFLVAAIILVESDNGLLASSLAAFFACVLILPFLWAPGGYVVEGRQVIVKRWIGETRITAAGEPRRWNWTWRGIRLWGSGGLYGFFGYFTFKGIGRVRMHITNRHNLVLVIDDKARKHLVSPDQPGRFILLLTR